jgi:hypothetical protein
MDQDFIAELDAALSNVGSDVLWKRTIGGVELWISPLQLLGQEKVAETINKMDLGANIINESKRMTLAHAIVGIGEHDLRQYRDGSPVFPIPGKDGKSARTTLDRYLYHKLGTWGAEYINDVFSVYADLMESFQKENVKDIRFDNAKDLREELAEVQARVFELRQQLNMPPLVEGDEPADPEVSANEGFEPPDESSDEPSEPTPPTSFDPFTVAPQQARPAPVRPAQVAIPLEPPVLSGAAAERAREAAEIEASLHRAPEPQLAAPVQQEVVAPVRHDVVDKPASREPVTPPVIDKTNISRNPRFRPPTSPR